MKKFNPKNTVIVTVEGGVADFFHVPKCIENVVMIDWDSLENGNCPLCGEELNDEVNPCETCGFDINISSDEWLEKE
jgi:hypothetical protein